MDETRMEPFVVSAGEAARLLGVSRPTVYAMLNRGALSYMKIGSRTLIPVKGLREWVEKHTLPEVTT